MPYVIGLTGNIGAGKSTVLNMLRRLGAEAIDADELVHHLLDEDPAVQQAVEDAFGAEVRQPDGRIDRKRLAAIVFSDQEALRRLEAIIHPVVERQIEARLAQTTAPVVVIEAIKLVEAGMHTRGDALWVVVCDPEIAIQRLVRQRGMDEEDARRRIASQAPIETKLALADVVIDNSGTLEETWAQVKRAWDAIPVVHNTSPRRFDIVFFDAWQTLFTIRAERLPRLHTALVQLGIHVPEAAVDRAMQEAEETLRAQERAWVRTREEETALFLDYYRLVLDRLGVDGSTSLAHRLLELNDYVKWCELFPEARSVLETLKERGQRIGMISNAYPSLLDVLDFLDITHYFDPLIVSALVGVEKPAAEIFRIALQRAGVPAHRALFVDDLAENVLAAMRIGMVGLRIVRDAQSSEADCPTIRSLEEVLTWLA